MKNLINKSLVVLTVLMLTISMSSCSKGNGIVDPTKDTDQNDKNDTNGISNTSDVDFNGNENTNTGN